ncbi:MAG: hypothetical protein HY909_01760 [Deltaproteobacteria bacterium]|nr:hypothetical protein [Deltaproteobacteria bacterium]
MTHPRQTLALLALALGCGETPGPDTSRVFVADERAGTLTVLEGASLRVVATVDLSEARDGGTVRFLPHNVQVAPDGQTVWATCASEPYYTRGYMGVDDEAVVIVDARSMTMRGRIPLRGLLAHVVFDGPGRFAYVTASNADEVVELSTATLTETRRLRLPPRGAPHGARWCAGRLFVALPGGRAIAWVELSTGAVDSVRVDGVPIQVACRSDGALAYSALQDTREVVSLDVASRAVRRLQLPDTARGPAQVYLSADGGRLWVADQGLLTSSLQVGNRAFAVDTAAWRVVGDGPTGLGAHGVVLSRDGARVYVTSITEHTVTLLDGRSRQALGVAPVGRGPNGISLLDTTGPMP